MNDLAVHAVLFAAIGLGIVTLGSFYSEAEDGKALRAVPRRFAMFALGCAILGGILIVAELTVARVS